MVHLPGWRPLRQPAPFAGGLRPTRCAAAWAELAQEVPQRGQERGRSRLAATELLAPGGHLAAFLLGQFAGQATSNTIRL